MILAVDPGSTTALVVRHRDDLVDRDLLEGLDLTLPYLPKAIDLVLTATLNLVDDHGPAILAVEGAVPPHGYNGGKIRIIDPAPIIGTAHLVGALISIGAIVIAPAGFGAPLDPGLPPKVARRILEATYPADLIGPRETTGAGKGPRQHLRAAWDLAGAADRQARSTR